MYNVPTYTKFGLHCIPRTDHRRKSRTPCIECDLPAIYYNSKKAWFTSVIFCNWFSFHSVHVVRTYQEQVLKIPSENVGAILILHNAPALLGEKKLVNVNGKIRVLYSPPNTTSILQPMDQGIISALKKRYISHYLNEIFVVLEEDRVISL